MKVKIFPQNAAFVQEFAKLTGVTADQFINGIFYAAFTAQASVPGWLVDFLQNLSLEDRASAERVAEFINVRSAEEALEGNRSIVTAEVFGLADGRFGIAAHVLDDGGWRPYRV